MCRDNARSRFIIHGARKCFAPHVTARTCIYAGIHNAPAIVVAQKPEVDVLERKGQRHAQPDHAIGDLHGFTVGRYRVEFVRNARHARIIA